MVGTPDLRHGRAMGARLSVPKIFSFPWRFINFVMNFSAAALSRDTMAKECSFLKYRLDVRWSSLGIVLRFTEP